MTVRIARGVAKTAKEDYARDAVVRVGKLKLFSRIKTKSLIKNEREDEMWYGSVYFLATMVCMYAGALGDMVLFLVSIVLFTGSIILSWFETKDLTWIFGVGFALIWVGAMGGVSWPIIRYPVPILGIVVGGVGYWLKLQKEKER